MSTIQGNILQISCQVCCVFYRWTDCFVAGYSWKYVSSDIIVFKINTHTHMQAHTHTCASLNAHVHTQTHMLVCTLTCMPNCTHKHACMHACMHAHTHSLTHTHTHTHTHSFSLSLCQHTHLQTLPAVQLASRPTQWVLGSQSKKHLYQCMAHYLVRFTPH